ncbi:hypothetical protein [Mycolicibacterium sp.]|uniref:aa3-type cytochrome oxidase subunit CtaJ n=1 Tax=Mycolicibacterium sp. TaxID=2320850 RepID=UPI0025FECA8E|nr:hypothetical protein [Mycolicibacterium sp.]
MPTGLLHAIPVALAALVVFLIYRRTGDRPAEYTLSQPWTHAPILWAAVDEAVPGSGHGHGHALNVGGGASGRW